MYVAPGLAIILGRRNSFDEGLAGGLMNTLVRSVGN